MTHEWVRISVSCRHGASDTACFPTKLEVVQEETDSVRMGNDDVQNADSKADPEDPHRGAESGTGVGEEELEAREHAL